MISVFAAMEKSAALQGQFRERKWPKLQKVECLPPLMPVSLSKLCFCISTLCKKKTARESIHKMARITPDLYTGDFPP